MNKILLLSFLLPLFGNTKNPKEDTFVFSQKDISEAVARYYMSPTRYFVRQTDCCYPNDEDTVAVAHGATCHIGGPSPYCVANPCPPGTSECETKSKN
ncbi:MAG: hypothetical protein OHK0019_04010 [Saprospiraceae bacterium]